MTRVQVVTTASQGQSTVLGVGGRPFCPVHDRQLSVGGTHFQVVRNYKKKTTFCDFKFELPVVYCPLQQTAIKLETFFTKHCMFFEGCNFMAQYDDMS